MPDKKDLPAEAFGRLQRTLSIPREHLACVLRIAPRTLTRRLLGSEEEARAWMTEPNRALGLSSTNHERIIERAI